MIKYPEEIKATMWERILRNERTRTQAVWIQGSPEKQAGSAKKKVVEVTLMVFSDQTSDD